LALLLTGRLCSSQEGAFTTDGKLKEAQGGELSGDVGGGDCSPTQQKKGRGLGGRVLTML